MNQIMLPTINHHTDNKRDLAIQCLANHLYSPNGLLKEQYELMATNISSARKRRLLICYFNDVLVGSILGIGNHIMVFVKPEYRRCGVASFLIGCYAKKYRIQKTSLEAAFTSTEVFAARGTTCTISTVQMPFSNYSSLSSTSNTEISNATLSCKPKGKNKNGVTVQVELSAGNGTIVNRYLANGSNHLFYNVYTNSTYSTILGNGNGGSAVIQACVASTRCGNSSTSSTTDNLTLYFYGAIPPNQDLPAGTYRDNPTLEIVF